MQNNQDNNNVTTLIINLNSSQGGSSGGPAGGLQIRICQPTANIQTNAVAAAMPWMTIAPPPQQQTMTPPQERKREPRVIEAATTTTGLGTHSNFFPTDQDDDDDNLVAAVVTPSIKSEEDATTTTTSEIPVRMAVLPSKEDLVEQIRDIRIHADISIAKASLQDILEGKWINDEIINGYVALLLQTQTKGRIAAMTTHFYTKLLCCLTRQQQDRGQQHFCYDNVRMWGQRQADKEGVRNIFYLDELWIPVHYNGNHWVTVIVRFDLKEIQVYDSLRDNKVNPLRFLPQTILKYLICEAKHKCHDDFKTDKWNCTFPDCPQQTNTFDCGLYVCALLFHNSTPKGIPKKQFELLPSRRMLVATLLQGHAMDICRGQKGSTEIMPSSEYGSFKQSGLVDMTVPPAALPSSRLTQENNFTSSESIHHVDEDSCGMIHKNDPSEVELLDAPDITTNEANERHVSSFENDIKTSSAGKQPKHSKSVVVERQNTKQKWKDYHSSKDEKNKAIDQVVAKTKHFKSSSTVGGQQIMAKMSSNLSFSSSSLSSTGGAASIPLEESTDSDAENNFWRGWLRRTVIYDNGDTGIQYLSPILLKSFETLEAAYEFADLIELHQDEDKAWEAYLATTTIKSSSSPRSSVKKQRRKIVMTKRTRPMPFEPRPVCLTDDAKTSTKYYAVDKVIDVRVNNKKKVEYKIRWKNCSDQLDSWLPEENLCDSALVEAKALRKKLEDSSRAKVETKSEDDDEKSIDSEEDETPQQDSKDDVPSWNGESSCQFESPIGKGWLTIVVNEKPGRKRPYQISPTKKCFFSMKSAMEFKGLVEKSKGDEEAAWLLFEKIKGRKLSNAGHRTMPPRLLAHLPPPPPPPPASTRETRERFKAGSKQQQIVDYIKENGWKTILGPKGQNYKTYYLSPSDLCFNSIPAVKEFLQLLDDHADDVELAWRAYKKRKGAVLGNYASKGIPPRILKFLQEEKAKKLMERGTSMEDSEEEYENPCAASASMPLRVRNFLRKQESNKKTERQKRKSTSLPMVAKEAGGEKIWRVTSEKMWRVTKIVDDRVVRGKKQYKLRWEGFTKASDSWEPESSIHDTTLIEEYLRDKRRKKQCRS